MSRTVKLWTAADFATGGKYASNVTNFPSLKMLWDFMDVPTTSAAFTTTDIISAITIDSAVSGNRDATTGELVLSGNISDAATTAMPAVPAGSGILMVVSGNPTVESPNTLTLGASAGAPASGQNAVRPLFSGSLTAANTAASDTNLCTATFTTAATADDWIGGASVLRADTGWYGAVSSTSGNQTQSVAWAPAAPANLTLDAAAFIASSARLFMAAAFYMPLARLPTAAQCSAIAAWQRWAAQQYPTNGNQKWLCPALAGV